MTTDTITKQVGDWKISVEQVDVTEYRARATNGWGGDFASGFDIETALRGLSDKLGIAQAVMLAAFGL